MDARKKISRREFIRLTGVAAGAAALAACAVPTPQVAKETAPAAVTPTIKLTHQVDPDEKVIAVNEAAVKEYKEVKPWVTIELQPMGHPDINELTARLAAGTMPDIYRYSLDRGPSLGLKNLLHDFAPFANDMKIVDKFVESVWKGYMWRDGQVWTFPSDANTFCLWCNPVLFERAGVKDLMPPKTWDEMVQAAKAIAKPDPDPNKAIWGFGRPTTIAWTSFWQYWWLWREGGDYYDGKNLIYKEAMIESIKKVQFLVNEKLLPALDNWQDAWYQGRMGMQEYGQWVVPADVPGPWNDYNPKGKWEADYPRPEFVVAPLPKFRDDVPGYSILAGFGYQSPKTNKHFTEAAEFLWWKISHPKHGQMYITPYNQLPAVKKEVVTHPWLDHPVLAAFQEQLKTTKPMTVYPEILQIIDECNPPLLINAFTGKITAEQAVEESYKCAEPIIREAQASR
ncbi:MAG: extracellular solute-binding protein [Anaerolineae bacterium]|nr:extracellular solute-binding protein [Anaerolineae bacterium]MDW8098075.1 extracellular solute-binding protein [Anaerolineae bacterium]